MTRQNRPSRIKAEAILAFGYLSVFATVSAATVFSVAKILAASLTLVSPYQILNY